MKIISPDVFSEYAPCREGVTWLKAQKKFDLRYLLTQAMKENHFDWANWGIVRLMSHEEKTKYAIFAAEQVLGIFEKKYPKEDRPRKAIEVAKEWLKNPCEETAYAAANAAANAAYAAANAAYAAYAAYATNAAAYAAVKAAADAAYAAAYAAANAAYAAYAAANAANAAYAANAAAYAAANAAYAAYAAANAAYAAYATNAAAYATNAAARRKMQIKILRYGVELLADKAGRGDENNKS